MKERLLTNLTEEFLELITKSSPKVTSQLETEVHPIRQIHWFSRLVDACIPSPLLNDSSQAFQARTLVTFVIILGFFAVIGVSFTIIVEQTLPLRRIITIAMVACMSFSIVIMRRTQQLQQAGLFFVVLTMLVVAYVDFVNRSIDGPATILWILPYAITAMLLGTKKAFYVGTGSLVLLLVNATLLQLDRLPSSLSSPDNWKWLRVVMFMVVLSVVAVCIYGLTTLERRRQRELSDEISLNKEVMDSLAKATNEAQVAARSKELFLATMSHELRTPLNGVLGNAQLLAREVENSNAKARVESISASGELLLSIINDVLDYSKFESQGVSLNPREFDLSKCLNQLCHLVKPRIAEGVLLSINGTVEPIYINADSHRLSQIVLNLLSNAAKFTERGHISLTLSTIDNGHIKIQVSDTGNGISEENQKRLFQDFVQVGDDVHKHMEGTGLGLAITRRIIERMEGEIEVISTPGKGTSMIVYLPVELVEEPAVDLPNVEEPQTDTPNDFSNLRVLIVDDVEMNCVMLEGMLEALEVKECHIEKDGHLAVERIKQDCNYDLILMDVRMPTMDGLEASHQIRKLGYSKPIIAVTANAFEEDRGDCLAAGMDDFLAKPVSLETLQDVLSEVLS